MSRNKPGVSSRNKPGVSPVPRLRVEPNQRRTLTPASPPGGAKSEKKVGPLQSDRARFVLGIDQAPGTVDFGQLLLRPYPGGSLSRARGSYRSVRGPISTGWKQVGDRFTFWAELPPNVSASVRIPSDRADEVRDAAGNPPAALASFPGARDAHEAVFQISSGAHEFSGPAMTGPGRSR